MVKHSKWCEPVSQKPSRTRPGEAQTAEALFRVFGGNIPVNGDIDDMYEFDSTKDSMETMFENSKTNEVVDHRQILDVMEDEFLSHSAQVSSPVVEPAEPSSAGTAAEPGQAPATVSAPASQTTAVNTGSEDQLPIVDGK